MVTCWCHPARHHQRTSFSWKMTSAARSRPARPPTCEVAEARWAHAGARSWTGCEVMRGAHRTGGPHGPPEEAHRSHCASRMVLQRASSQTRRCETYSPAALALLWLPPLSQKGSLFAGIPVPRTRKRAFKPRTSLSRVFDVMIAVTPESFEANRGNLLESTVWRRSPPSRPASKSKRRGEAAWPRPRRSDSWLSRRRCSCSVAAA